MPVYFITGANRGLGLEFVRQLSPGNENTIIACTRSLDSDLTDLKALGNGNVHILQCDTGSLSSISALEESVPHILGDKKIDFLFNNAGINPTSADTSLTIDPDSLKLQLDVNVIGPAKIVETLRAHLAKGAVIMNMTSGLGSLNLSLQNTKCCTYSISKAALNMVTVHQAHDLRGEAIVITMDPGWVKTRLGGVGAILEPEESIGGMLKVLRGLKPEDTAKFYHYSGNEIPW
jgi:NAD(P)-dependent dehydrogenase (short-subunit alcohol dehydrogenase family)